MAARAHPRQGPRHLARVRRRSDTPAEASPRIRCSARALRPSAAACQRSEGAEQCAASRGCSFHLLLAIPSEPAQVHAQRRRPVVVIVLAAARSLPLPFVLGPAAPRAAAPSVGLLQSAATRSRQSRGSALPL